MIGLVNTGFFRNKIINGDFSVNQRACLNYSIEPNSNYFPADRFRTINSTGNYIGNFINKSTVNNDEFSLFNEALFNDGSELVLCNPDENNQSNLLNNSVQFNLNGNFLPATKKFLNTGVSFDGSNVHNTFYLDARYFSDFISFGFWLKIENFVSTDSIRTIMNFGDKTFELGIDGNGYLNYAYSNDGTTWNWVRYLYKLRPYQWYYISGSVNKATGEIFVYINNNRTLTISNAIISPFGTGGVSPVVSNAVSFGGRLDSLSTPTFNSTLTITNIRVFNRILNENELSQLMLNSKSKIINKGLLFLPSTSLKQNNTTLLSQSLEFCMIEDLLKYKKGVLSFDFKSSKQGKYAVVFQNYKDLTIKKVYTFEYNNEDVERIILPVGLNELNLEDSFNYNRYNQGALKISLISYDSSLNLNDLTDLNSGDLLYINNIQFENGSQASEFEEIPFDIQLYRCKRYYEKSYYYDIPTEAIAFSGCNSNYSGGEVDNYIGRSFDFEVDKRATPSITVYNPSTGAKGQIYLGGGTGSGNSIVPLIDLVSTKKARVIRQNSLGYTNSTIQFHWEIDAEL